MPPTIFQTPDFQTNFHFPWRFEKSKFHCSQTQVIRVLVGIFLKIVLLLRQKYPWIVIINKYMAYNSVNCDRPGECSPEKDWLGWHWLTFPQPERKSSSKSSLMMTSTQVVETSVNVTSISPYRDYTHPDDHNLPNCDLTPGFKPFTVSQIHGCFTDNLHHTYLVPSKVFVSIQI